jgi:hypothetical protein
MDHTKLDSGQVLAAGILNRSMPTSHCPDDAQLQDVDEDHPEAFRSGLEAGGLKASMYYGCWSIWKTDQGYSGELFQYRSCTEAFANQSIEHALEKAHEWYEGCYG